LAEAYAALLAGPGVERGLIGPSEAARIWDRHLLNCAVVATLIPQSCVVADLGSGAGLPGLVLAIMRPLAQVVLVEPMARRTAFLAECIGELGLTNLTVRRARAEELAGQIGADIVISRAVARLDRLAGIASGLARPGGLILAIKGDAAAEELDQAKPVLDRLGATDVGVISVGAGVISQPTTVIRFRTGAGPVRRR
jgi:16S rRNA (guanine527-N7)-methyltransferase